MLRSQRALLIKCLVALGVILLTFFLPSTVQAHGGPQHWQPGHNETTPLGLDRYLIILALAIPLTLLVALLYSRRSALKIKLTRPLKLCFTLLMVIIAAGCFLNRRQDETQPTRTPPATSVQTPTDAATETAQPAGHEGDEG